MTFTTCSNRPRIVFLISSGSGMRAMTTQKARRRSGGIRVRLQRPVSSLKTRILTPSSKPSYMLVLLRHGKQNTFCLVLNPSDLQPPTQERRAF